MGGKFIGVGWIEYLELDGSYVRHGMAWHGIAWHGREKCQDKQDKTVGFPASSQLNSICDLGDHSDGHGS
ncbi:hypothetical protein BPAE_0038g00580 [Botrytis paeoniae]|uniref:Uncharacterized protein n=1 Tax=Botrytis paeoniae TaxID=278948 RepID=A0A4Z1FXF2_9HELO|nr:hypothetical protein BPAE_0038g00580 [Botrytis paeoniae]